MGEGEGGRGDNVEGDGAHCRPGHAADLFPVLIFSHLKPHTWKGWRWRKMRTEEEARWQETTEGSERRTEAEKVTGGYGSSPEGGATSQCLPVWDDTQKKRREWHPTMATAQTTTIKQKK